MFAPSADERLPADTSSGNPFRAEVPPPADNTLHWVLLGISSLVIVAALTLQVHGDEFVVIPWLNMPLPGSCTFKAYFGLDCPGCGLTRCFISLAHGDIRRAVHFNPVGIAFFMVVAGQIPYRSLQLWRTRRGLTEMHTGWWGYWLMGFILVALLVQWVIRGLLWSW